MLSRPLSIGLYYSALKFEALTINDYALNCFYWPYNTVDNSFGHNRPTLFNNRYGRHYEQLDFGLKRRQL